MKFTVPKPTYYILRQDHRTVLDYLAKNTADGGIQNILITGRQGCGKSILASQYAAVYKRPYAVFEVGLLSEAAEFFGMTILRNGQTEYRTGLFTEAVQTPGAVVHLQELNRPENDKTLNAIFSVLDPDQRKVWIDEYQDWVQVAPGVTFIATINEGYEFIGTMPMDTALADRFAVTLRLDYLPSDEEHRLLVANGIDPEDATTLVTLANGLRYNSQNPIDVSTRKVIQMGRLVKYGVPFITVVDTVLATTKEELERILQEIHFSTGDTLDTAIQYEVFINAV